MMTPPPSAPPPSAPPGDFSLSFPESITVQQGGAPQSFQITATLSGNVGSSTVAVSFPNLPAGLALWPSQSPNLGVNQVTSANFFLFTNGSASPGQVTVNIIGTLGSVSHSFSLPVTITTAASFHLSVVPSQLSLTPGTPGRVQVSVIPASGPGPQVSLATTTLPMRYDFANPLLSGSQPGPFTLTFDATVASQPLTNFPVFITATDNSGNTATTTLPVSLSVPFPPITAPTRSTIVRTDDIPAGAIYDPNSKLVYVALPNLNEVRVYSSIDAHQVASIPASHPSSLDESGNGKRIFAGGFGQIMVIDPSSHQVLQTSELPTTSGQTTTPPLKLVALSTGNVLALSGTQLYLWNPTTLSATQVNPPNFSGTISLARSGDRSKVLLVSGAPIDAAALVYDAASGTFGNSIVGIAGANAAMNNDGSQIAVITSGFSDMGGFLNIYDGQFNLLASQPLYNIDSPGQVIYSFDGKSFFAFFPQPDVGNAGIAYDATSLSPLGLFSISNQYGTVASLPFAVDETNMIFGTETGNALPTGTLVYTDASHPGAMAPDAALEAGGASSNNVCPGGSATLIGGGPYPPVPNVGFPDPICLPAGLNPAGTFGLSGSGFDPSVAYGLFVGPAPALVSSEAASGVSVFSFSELDFHMPLTPPNNTMGPVNLTLARPDGWYQVMPEAYSYGPTALLVDPSVIPPSGQNTINILGYDFANPMVSISGQAATVVSSGSYSNNVDGVFPLQQIQATAPNGSGGSGDVTVSTALGSTTLPGAIQYLSSAQVYPITGSLSSVIYDQPRQRLYISNNDCRFRRSMQHHLV